MDTALTSPLTALMAASVDNDPVWMDSVHAGLHVLSILVGVIGVAVVVWGVLTGALRLLRLEWAALRGGNVLQLRKELRHHIGFYLLLGLEFLVAADIIETVIAPTWEHLVILGGIVLIRTVISFSLNWELSRKESP